MSGISKFNNLKELAEKYSSDKDSDVDCALILYPMNYSETYNDQLLNNAHLFVDKLSGIDYDESELGPILLMEVMGLELNDEVEQKFRQFYREIYSSATPSRNNGIATALLILAVSKGGPQLLDRFKTARDYLNRFSENTLTVPAAMLTLVAFEIEETLDALRLASSAIALHKLSLGGMENLSLGMKMLLQSSVLSSVASIPLEQRPKYVIPQGIVPVPMLGILLPSHLPIALTAFAAFHELSMHKLAVSDYRFHPVHRHFNYE